MKKLWDKEKLKHVMLSGVCAYVMIGQSVYASGQGTDVLTPLKNLVSFFTGAVAIYGGFVVVKSILEINTAWQNQDNSSLSSAVKALIGGLVMAGISGFLTFIGFSAV